MADAYLMKKTFEVIVDYTVGQIEGLLTSIKIVDINGAPAEMGYMIQKGDKATIAVEMPKKKDDLIKD